MHETKKITDFLKKFKFNLNRRFTLIPRDKNLATFANLGITPKHAKNIIASLTYKHYYKGPSNDRNHSKYKIWEFGVTINGQ